MSTTLAGALFAGSLVLALAASYRPVGDLIHRALTSPRHTRAERVVHRLTGTDPDGEQTPGAYARSVLAFSLVGVLAVYALQRLQPHLPLSQGNGAVPADLAWNTAVSFVTNTNWQNYVPEATLGAGVQLLALAVQNVLSAAVGIAVAIALVRGLARSGSAHLGSFWVDLVRLCLRVLLPGAAIAAVLLIATGVLQNLGAAV